MSSSSIDDAAPSTRAGFRRLRRVSVLGSTGSVGRAACSVIAAMPEHLEIVALAARSKIDLLAEQTLRHRPALVALADPTLAEEFRYRVGSGWSGRVVFGQDGVVEAAAFGTADVVLNGLVGAAGLRPSRAAIRAGKNLALANKESLVIAGSLLTREAAQSGARVLPVDSEHSALFQLLEGRSASDVTRLILTASGGPFLGRSLASLAGVTPAEALRHPTWEMGPRITIDSATMLNKGFEVIEARWLFAIDPSRIDVWIHPQSIVHGLVEWVDGALTAHLSVPDMHLPIQYALCHPERHATRLPPCDLARSAPLQFSAPEPGRYPCLELARRALVEGGTAPAVLNGADEIAVGAFLGGRIRFPDIATCLERVLEQHHAFEADDLEAILEADGWARKEASRVIDRLR